MTSTAVHIGQDRQTFLLELNDRLRRLDDAGDIRFEASRALGERLAAARVGYAEAEPDGAAMLVTHCYAAGVAPIEGLFRCADFDSALLPDFLAGRTVVRRDVANDASLTEAQRSAHRALDVGSMIDVPLVKGTTLVALLFLHVREARQWTDDDVGLVEEVAERTWAAVERARAEGALRESEARLRLALDLAELGTWSFRLADGMGDLDERSAAIVGLPHGTFADVAKAQMAAVHPEDLAGLTDAVAQGIARGVTFDLSYRVVHPDRSVHHVASRACVVADEVGRPVRVVGINRDVTAEREAELERVRLLAGERSAREEAERAQREAEAANRAKGEFLAVMSHELRTPLNAIGGYAELMELGLRGPVNEQQRQDLARIQQSQRHLLGLINQVLNYTRVDAGAVRYDLTDVPVGQALAAADALIVPQVRARGLAYAIASVPPSLVVRADREKLQQILLNVLGNAIKFTEPGGEIRVECAERDGRIAVSVTDTGVGIEAEKLATIFEPFVQADQRLARPHEGIGLGLAISRDLARGMGGDLAAVSERGKGSTFTLELPRVVHA